MKEAILLGDRGVVTVSGADATKFLHNLVTNDVAKLKPDEARFCALLTPQGKILFDFLVFPFGGDGYLIDCPLALEADLIRRLTIYKLRSVVEIASKSAELAAFAILPDERPDVRAAALARDPRSEKLGWRAIAARGALPAAGARENYEARRIAAGVPAGGVDFAYGDAFPHEANMDLLSGVDYTKGCYVGQEVVSRVKHRGLARKRLARYTAQGVAPPPGTQVLLGETDIGVTGSALGDKGLALVKVEKLAEARAAGVLPKAAGVALEFPEAAG